MQVLKVNCDRTTASAFTLYTIQTVQRGMYKEKVMSNSALRRQ
jgi:hypothetical protein